jgi:hypothetical protein
MNRKPLSRVWNLVNRLQPSQIRQARLPHRASDASHQDPHDEVLARDKMNCPECSFVIDKQATYCMFCRVILISDFPTSPERTVDHSAFR